MDLLQQINELQMKLRELYLQHYLQYELFSLVWWVEIAIIVIPLLVWWKVVDKKRLLEISLFGLLVNIAASIFDVAGSDYVLWDYPVHVLPRLPLFLPVDYVIVPIVGMIIYQKCPRWGVFLIFSTLAAALMAFAGEPLAVHIGMYNLYSWRYIYSLPIYIIIYSTAKFITHVFSGIQTGAS